MNNYDSDDDILYHGSRRSMLISKFINITYKIGSQLSFDTPQIQLIATSKKHNEHHTSTSVKIVKNLSFKDCLEYKDNSSEQSDGNHSYLTGKSYHITSNFYSKIIYR